MIAVEIRNLHKIYKIYQTPVDRVKEIILRKPHHEKFSALRDIDLTILQGETYGIIGENGSGKSTLLKIIARALQPSSGGLKINGRTAALLELGAGFNPELSGEENIYLNAYLMGLTKDEVDRKKTEIIEFAELEDFIKRPVKTYSSGMHVRLAFSIATSVDPEILIIDEALSVGDDHFQRKCINRMLNFKEAGKTIIFCSHSMYLVQELCMKAIWLHHGKIRSNGESSKVISDYQNYERERIASDVKDEKAVSDDVPKDKKQIYIGGIKILCKDGSETESLEPMDSVLFSFKVMCRQNGIKGHVGFMIIRNDEVWTFGTSTSFDGLEPVIFNDGQEITIRINSLPLLQGKYFLMAVVLDESGLHTHDQARSNPFFIEGNRKEVGMVYIDHEWII